MNCPKCGFQQNDGLECLRCGLVFSRFHAGPPPPLYANPAPSPLRMTVGYLIYWYRRLRWFSLAALITAFVLILRTADPPRIAVPPDAANLADEKIHQFQSSIKHGSPGKLELEEQELNGWLGANLSIQRAGSPPAISTQSPESLISLAKIATGGESIDRSSLQRAQSSVRDVQVVLRDDQMGIYVLFDFHGKDLSLELNGRLSAQDGYLRLEPTSGKLGSLPLLSGTLRAVANRLFDSPENKEQFRLPPDIEDIRVEKGTLVVTSR